MSSTTEQRMALETAVIACLNAGDSIREVKDAVDEFIESLTIVAEEEGAESNDDDDDDDADEEAPAEPAEALV